MTLLDSSKPTPIVMCHDEVELSIMLQRSIFKEWRSRVDHQRSRVNFIYMRCTLSVRKAYVGGRECSKVLPRVCRADTWHDVYGLLIWPVANCNLATLQIDSTRIAKRLCIVHEESKPNNVFVPPKGLLFTDFGLSTDFSDQPWKWTRNGIRGTPKYFSPEIAAYEICGQRSDLSSTGWLVLQLLLLGAFDRTMEESDTYLFFGGLL